MYVSTVRIVSAGGNRLPVEDMHFRGAAGVNHGHDIAIRVAIEIGHGNRDSTRVVGGIGRECADGLVEIGYA